MWRWQRGCCPCHLTAGHPNLSFSPCHQLADLLQASSAGASEVRATERQLLQSILKETLGQDPETAMEHSLQLKLAQPLLPLPSIETCLQDESFIRGGPLSSVAGQSPPWGQAAPSSPGARAPLPEHRWR